MNIDSIRNGIVLDHIKAGKSMDIYRFLGLDNLDCSVAIIKNAPSAKMGRKDIIKDGQRIRKEHLTLPRQIRDVLKCKNPRCITSVEQDLPHIFKLTNGENATYRCLYCETKAERP